ACRSASSERADSSSPNSPQKGWEYAPPAKPDWSRKSASWSSRAWRLSVSASSARKRVYVVYFIGALPEISGGGELSRNGRPRAPVLWGARPPQLPAFFPRTGRVPHRHLDAEHRAGVAGPRPDEFALLRRPRLPARLARRAAAHALRRRARRSHQQAPPRHPH